MNSMCFFTDLHSSSERVVEDVAKKCGMNAVCYDGVIVLGNDGEKIIHKKDESSSIDVKKDSE